MGGRISGNEIWWWVWYLRWAEPVSVCGDQVMTRWWVWWVWIRLCCYPLPPAPSLFFFPYIFSSRFSHPSAFWKAHSKPPFSLKLVAPSLFFFPDIFSLKPSPKSPYWYPLHSCFSHSPYSHPLFYSPHSSILCSEYPIMSIKVSGPPWIDVILSSPSALEETSPHSKTCCQQSAPKII